MNIEPGEGVVNFSLVQGGPFHRLLGYLWLTGLDRLPTMRAVIVLVAVAWLPLALLTVVQTMVENRQAVAGFWFELDYLRALRHSDRGDGGHRTLCERAAQFAAR